MCVEYRGGDGGYNPLPNPWRWDGYLTTVRNRVCMYILFPASCKHPVAKLVCFCVFGKVTPTKSIVR